MPKKKIKAINLNLIPKDPFFATPVGKMLKWALSIGRYIVIFTELIVIGSFLTRFNLDRQVTNINEDIFQKKVIIESYGSLENDVRVMQKRIEEYKQVEQKENLSSVFPKLQSLTPQGVIYNELKISDKRIDLQGSALSQNAFSIFANNLQLTPDLGQISINRISSDNDNSSNGAFDFDVIIIKPIQQ